MAKVLCYNKQAFDRVMMARGFNDFNVGELKTTAFISIGEPGEDGQHYFKTPHDNVLNIDFYDIDEYSIRVENPGKEIEWDKIPRGLTKEEAQVLYDFIKRHLGKDFYVHCSAGISRSQAVVHFLLNYYHDYYTFDDINKDNPPRFPNLHVVSRLRGCYIYDMYNEAAAELIKESNENKTGQ